MLSLVVFVDVQYLTLRHRVSHILVAHERKRPQGHCGFLSRRRRIVRAWVRWLATGLRGLVLEEVAVAEAAQECGLVAHLENLLDVMELEAALAYVILGVQRVVDKWHFVGLEHGHFGN